MARLQLDIKGRRDGESTAMGDEERCKRDGDVGAAGSGSDKRQRGIQTYNVVLIKLNHYILAMLWCWRSDGTTRAAFPSSSGMARQEGGRSVGG
jgi:hypothetical protein